MLYYNSTYRLKYSLSIINSDSLLLVQIAQKQHFLDEAALNNNE